MPIETQEQIKIEPKILPIGLLQEKFPLIAKMLSGNLDYDQNGKWQVVDFKNGTDISAFENDPNPSLRTELGHFSLQNTAMIIDEENSQVSFVAPGFEIHDKRRQAYSWITVSKERGTEFHSKHLYQMDWGHTDGKEGADDIYKRAAEQVNRINNQFRLSQSVR